MPTTKPELLIKYALDIAIATICIILFLPIFIIIGLAIKLNSPGPAFFKQERIGLNGNPFTIFKFRTMVDNAVNIGSRHKIVNNDPRITATGRFLREWSLDELPQLINIVKGDMSFIGPRPTLKYQVVQYTAQQRNRLNMKPGVTGWAQVNGRNKLTWEKRIVLDVWYVENWSLTLDLKIFLRTFSVIFQKDNIYNENGAAYDFNKPSKNNDD